MLRFCCLGSGSEGNALLVEASDGLFATRVLVDNGFGPRQLAKRLARAGLAADDLDALLVTHEHSDHVGGAPALLKPGRLPLLASVGTAQAAGLADYARFARLRDGEAIAVGALLIRPVAVPHDAAEPLQFVFTDGCRALGLLTDIGVPTPAVATAFGQLDALILECNHDAGLLAASDYPPFLKSRIAGDHGHLSNAQAACLLAQIDRSRLQQVAAAHLSRRNNRRDLAQAALADVLGCASHDILVADQDVGLDWIEV